MLFFSSLLDDSQLQRSESCARYIFSPAGACWWRCFPCSQLTLKAMQCVHQRLPSQPAGPAGPDTPSSPGPHHYLGELLCQRPAESSAENVGSGVADKLSPPLWPACDSRSGWTFTLLARVLQKVATCSAVSVPISSGALNRRERLNWRVCGSSSSVGLTGCCQHARAAAANIFDLASIWRHLLLQHVGSVGGKTVFPTLSWVSGEWRRGIFFILICLFS